MNNEARHKNMVNSAKSGQKNKLFYAAIVLFVLILVEFAYMVYSHYQNDEQPQAEVADVFKEREVSYQECLNYFNRDVSVIDNDVSNPYLARYYAICKAVKAKDTTKCDVLLGVKDENLRKYTYENCLSGTKTYLNEILPMVNDEVCSQEGPGGDGFYQTCQAITNNDVSLCGDIVNNIQKTACRAIMTKNVDLCDDIDWNAESTNKEETANLQMKDTIGQCRDTYYLVRALNENDEQYINNIVNEDTRIFAWLHFKQDSDCVEIMKSSIVDRCAEIFDSLLKYCDVGCPATEPEAGP